MRDPATRRRPVRKDGNGLWRVSETYISRKNDVFGSKIVFFGGKVVDFVFFTRKSCFWVESRVFDEKTSFRGPGQDPLTGPPVSRNPPGFRVFGVEMGEIALFEELQETLQMTVSPPS